MGAASLTVITTSKVADPPEFVAVTTYPAVVETDVGVPEITPVVVLNESPAGSAGETEYDVTLPVTEGSSAVMAVPTVNTFGELYESSVGADSPIEICTVKTAVPPE